MTTILFVKTSSLGDVVHNCPAVSDAARALPGAAIDWVVEEPFAAIARMHRSVRRVIPVADRRWRSRSGGAMCGARSARAGVELAAQRYDAVVDTQSLFKSALITRAACGTRHGLDRVSAREWLAAPLYDVRHVIPRDMHAVERNRRLAASALGFSVTGPPEYGLHVPAAHGSGHVVFLTMTSRADNSGLSALDRAARSMRAPVVLPWGSEDERMRAQRIADAIGATVLREETSSSSPKFLSPHAPLSASTPALRTWPRRSARHRGYLLRLRSRAHRYLRRATRG